MMPVQIYADVPLFDVEWFLPCCSINDAPRFPYRDYYQSPDMDNEPLACGWCVPVERCYSFEPFIEGMTEEEKSYILGVQANLWTEYIETQEHLEYMLLPRMTALSEVQW